MGQVTQDTQANQDWDTELIRRYDLAGPRYTSYPTANLFHERFGANDYLQLANTTTEQNSIAPLSLYIHIPFCRDICYYCACNKVVTRKHALVIDYLDAVAEELSLRGALHGHRPVTQLHWGGGTPTYLSEAELTELWHHIATNFRTIIGDHREYSIEIDPRTVQPSTLALLKGLGFNRISMGIQDFDPLVQQNINRIQRAEDIEDQVQLIRDLKFSSLSFDLIYGLPGQTVASSTATIDRVIEMAPDRIAFYNYAHLPQMFSNQRAISRHRLPSANQKLAILGRVGQRLLAAGYDYIGMDHFVRPGDALARARRERKLRRNFQGYSSGLAPDLIGVGPSSISRFKGCFSQNARSLQDWSKALRQKQLPIVRGLSMSDEDKLREHIIMSIACHLEIDIPDLEDRFQIDFYSKFDDSIKRLHQFEQDGLVELGTDKVRVLPRGRLLLRNICMLFDAYLCPELQQGGFSRTI